MEVVLYGDYPARQADRLRRLLGPGHDVLPLPYALGREAIAPVLARAQVMVANAYGREDPPVPSLRLLQSPSAGMEGIDTGCLPPGCEVRTVGGHEIAMAEYVLCAMLDWQIGFRSLAATVRDGRWSQRDWIKGPVHGEAFGATLGLVGFGRIGREVAARAQAFGMKVAALSRWSRPEAAPPPGVTPFCLADRSAFLRASDFVVVALPLDDTTRGLVDAEWFAEMKPEAVLIHVGRGPVVEEVALFEALRSRRIRGATIDVWYRYPESEEAQVPIGTLPFHELQNLVVTPHGSGRTHQMFERRWQEIAESIRLRFQTLSSSDARSRNLLR